MNPTYLLLIHVGKMIDLHISILHEMDMESQP